MSKTIVLNERQYNNLFLMSEAMMEGFRLDMLRGKSFRQKVIYLNEYLGKPIGRGSSRYVYQIDDNTVLKLAINAKGLAQNEREYSILRDQYSSIVPNVYNGSDDTNYEWIITDFVLPASKNDFKALVGVPFETIQRYCVWADTIIHPERDRGNYKSKMRHEFYIDNENNEELIELVSAIDDLIGSYDIEPGDLSKLNSWGIKNYNGQAGLVVLDTGLSADVYKQYYGWK